MNPPQQFQTSRLLLRLPTLSDAESSFHNYVQDPQVTRYLPWQPHTHIDQTRAFLAGCIEAWRGSTRFPFVITLLNENQAIGMVELRLDGFMAEVGYVLGQAFWSKGYMSEAVQALVDWWKQQPDLYRFWAICDVDNIGSARVMEKVGMQREGRLRRYILHSAVSSEPRDCYLYSIVK